MFQLDCVVPENIHTPSREGICRKPHLLPGISILLSTKIPLTLPEFPRVLFTPTMPMVLKVNVNTPNT